MVEKVGIEPTCPKATGLQPAALPLEHLLLKLLAEDTGLEPILAESKSAVLTNYTNPQHICNRCHESRYFTVCIRCFSQYVYSHSLGYIHRIQHSQSRATRILLLSSCPQLPLTYRSASNDYKYGLQWPNRTADTWSQTTSFTTKLIGDW